MVRGFHAGRLLPLLCVWGLYYSTCGCRAAPRAERYFDRLDPYDTLSGFAYAVETSQWEFAFDCLTEDSKKHYTFSKFRLALQLGVEVPELKKSLWELIVKSQRSRHRYSRLAATRVVYHVRYEDAEGEPGEVKIHLERESADDDAKPADATKEPRWRIDLERTVREFGGGALSAFEGA